MKRFFLLALFGPSLAALACDNCKIPKPAAGQRVVEYDLTIAEQTVSPAGKAVRGFTINGSIPGPVLRFREGDFARIRVHNDLKNEKPPRTGTACCCRTKRTACRMSPRRRSSRAPRTRSSSSAAQRHLLVSFSHASAGAERRVWRHRRRATRRRAGEGGSRAGAHPLRLDDTDPMEVMRMLMRGSDYFGLMRRNSQSILGAWQRGNLKDYFRASGTA
jgi:FtsP/CotA-like multicopper oxidase with cupredoxin domain